MSAGCALARISQISAVGPAVVNPRSFSGARTFKRLEGMFARPATWYVQLDILAKQRPTML